MQIMKKIALILAALLTVPFTAMADGVTIEPGQWEMTMSMQMPMFPVPQEQAYTECVKETELDPEDFQMEGDQACEFSDVEMQGDSISWSMECPNEMGSTRGQWSFTSTGDSMHGNGSMTTEMGGQSMEFTMTWSGKRIGDCPE
jgi:hypothetical protein